MLSKHVRPFQCQVFYKTWLKYSISDNTHEILLDNSCDPDKNFFDTDIQNIDTPFILPEEFESFSCKLNSKSWPYHDKLFCKLWS